MKQYLLTRNWTDERSLGCVAKTLCNDETNPKSDPTDTHI